MKTFQFVIQLLVILGALAFATNVSAQDDSARVDLILPSQNAALTSLAQRIGEAGQFHLNTYIGTLPERPLRGNILLVVSDSLLPMLQADGYDAKFALYVNSSQYEALTPTPQNSTALFSDQPLTRQLALINTLFGEQSVRLGLAYRNPQFLQIVTDALANMPNISLDARQIPDSYRIQTINQIIQNNQVLLATPEQTLYNSQSIRAILQASYRHHTLLIGPSEGFVDAGALASVVSTPEHYSSEILQMINQFVNEGKIPPPRPPGQFRVKLNNNVARSLGLSLPDEQTLLNSMLGQ
ncbi:hypothetical protein NCG89_09780 [Spongiibacter taiwanensis]|uniref:hypothetical protein n=1 Tax=Spongiibacter taiwanensis TaxID=1748242 RepID=UPI00203541CE|nr:hypothetical protein [Spongiibacter taiwanensis]USA41806.1 hypothetical protein NCG89_09780 [Spongiibacter taiwanensis]